MAPPSILPGTLSILATVFPPAERQKAIAIWAAVAGGSVAISIIWSGAMLEHFWWGAIFLGMAFVAAAALAVGFFLLPTSRHSEKARLDPVGAALSVIAVTGLLYGLIEAPDNGWTAGQILAAFVVGIVGVASFVVWERSSSNPMLDIAFFSQRRFSFGSLSIVAAYFALFGMYFVLTQYLQLVRGYSPFMAGVYTLPAGLAQLAVANLSRPLVARNGFRPVLVGGLAASAAGLLVLATCGTTSPMSVTEIGLSLLGVGIGLTMPPATGAIMASLPPHKVGVGSAINDLTRELGGAFGIGVLGSLTLSRYRSRLSPVVAHRPVHASAEAKSGLAQALANLGGAHSAADIAARDAYTSGFDLAMIVGVVVVGIAAVAVCLGLAGNRPIPVPRMSAPDHHPQTPGTLPLTPAGDRSSAGPFR